MAKKTKKSTKSAKRSNGAEVAQRKCLCGCGQLAAKKRNFKQGHDAKLRHKAVAVIKGKESHKFTGEQVAFLKGAGYVTGAEASQIA